MWTVLLVGLIAKRILYKLRCFDRIYTEGMRLAAGRAVGHRTNNHG
jgi:hypothetical protein